MSAAKTFTSAYRLLIDELLERGVTEVTRLSAAHLTIILRQHAVASVEFTDEQTHEIADAVQVSPEVGAAAIARIVSERIWSHAKDLIEHDLALEREQRELDEDRPHTSRYEDYLRERRANEFNPGAPYSPPSGSLEP